MFIAKLYSKVYERKGTKKDGTEFKVRYQEADILRENHRPRVVEISVRNDDRYEEGLYTLSADSFRPDRYDHLEMAYPTLVPLDEAVKIAERSKKQHQKLA